MQKKWYKQFWPWFLIAVPAASMAMGVLIVYLATTGEDSLVSDDYYKEGKGINQDLSKIQLAKDLGYVGLLEVSDDSVKLRFQTSAPKDATALRLVFFHNTLEEKDYVVMLTRNATGQYVGYPTQSLKGKWRLTLSDINETWKIRQTIGLPYSGSITLAP